MKRSDAIQKYLNVINLFEDYSYNKQARSHDKYDLSIYDDIGKPRTSAQNVQQKSPINKTSLTPQQSVPAIRKMVELANTVSLCRKCKISSINYNKVTGRGSIPAKIFVISFHTTDNEEKQMRPLTGKVLEQFSKWMDAIQIDMNDIFVTNLIKCNPKNEIITKDYIENCINHLDDEIKIIQPIIILALGSVVISSLNRKFVDINKYHGIILNYKGLNVFPTYHPEETLQNPFLKKAVWEDLQKFRACYDRLLADNGAELE